MDPSIIEAAASIDAALWALVSSSAVFLFLRFCCKSLGRGLQWDDLVLFASWVAVLGYAIFWAVLLSTSTEATPALSPDTTSVGAILILSTTTIAIAGQSWSKTSFAITLLHISGGWTKRFLWFAIISMNLLFGLGALFLWVSCTPVEKTWHPLMQGNCWDPSVNVYYGIVISAYSGIMDLAFAALSWSILIPLQITFHEKIGCAIAMSMGVFAGVSAFMKCLKLPAMDPNNASREWAQGVMDGTALVFWGAAEPAITIMAASVPAMRVLIGRITAPKRAPTSRNDKERALATWDNEAEL